VKILQILEQNREGVQDAMLTQALGISESDKINALNQLIEDGRIQLMKNKTGSLVYKYQSADKAKKFSDLSIEDVAIFNIIEEAGNKGTWLLELKKKSNMTSVQIKKILKKLEKKEIVKSVKSIQAKNKYIWMLAELEPPNEITGGIWYGGSEFDKEFVELIYDKCLEYIAQEKISSVKDVAGYVRSLGVLNVDIRDEDVQTILNCLMFDDKIEEVKNEIMLKKRTNEKGEKVVYYKTANWFTPRVAFVQVPCAHCPVFSECKPGNVINPQTCKYYTEWLNF